MELGNDPIGRTQRQDLLARLQIRLERLSKRNGTDGPMVFLPLMLIWLRDPMYFNAPSRWAMVALAVSIGLLAPELSAEKQGTAAAADFSRSDRANTTAGIGAGAPSAGDPGAAGLLREGTRLTNRIGQFSRSETEWYFTPSKSDRVEGQDGSSTSSESASPAASPTSPSTLSRVRVLENLALQRVAQMIQQDPSDHRWMITGVITEFFGENRLLIIMAVRAPIDDETKR